jgi:glycosyltransferase involved in cell wall biosynthesis
LTGSRLEVAGYMGPEHRDYLRSIQKQMSDWGLDGELRYRGTLDRAGKIEFLQGLDVLSVPSGYKEPKGMYLLEAMACGIPVVQPRHGAFPEILEKTGGGILVDSEVGTSVAEGIVSIWKDPGLATELGRKGRDGVHRHYSVEQEARRTLEVYANHLSKSARRQTDWQEQALRVE